MDNELTKQLQTIGRQWTYTELAINSQSDDNESTHDLMRAVNRQPGFRPGTRRVFKGWAQEGILPGRALKTWSPQ